MSGEMLIAVGVVAGSAAVQVLTWWNTRGNIKGNTTTTERVEKKLDQNSVVTADTHKMVKGSPAINDQLTAIILTMDNHEKLDNERFERLEKLIEKAGK